MQEISEANVNLIKLQELEELYPDLSAAKSNRSLIEYYFTCTPSLICYVLGQSKIGDFVTYVDGDLFFFSNPEPIYQELGSGSVAIIPHRFAVKARHLERFGIYNVGWVTFRNDSRGREVVDWWQARCIEWCYDSEAGDRFADQKYLEQFQNLSEGVVVIQNPGANLAPWNLGRHNLVEKDGELFIDGGAPLLFFHFHGLRIVGKHLYIADHFCYGASFGPLVRRQIYRPYVRNLAAISMEVDSHAASSAKLLTRHVSGRSGLLGRIFGSLRRPLKNIMAILLGEFLVVVRGRAL